MRIKIYQIDPERDTQNVKFLGMANRERLYPGQAVDPSIYDEVCSAEIETSDLEEIYRRFNTEGHPLHRGHSLSISDVVVMGNDAYFCDSIGFRKITFDEAQTHKPDDLMRVVYVEPGKPPYEAEIPTTLEGQQRAVMGLIDLVYLGNDTILVCNDEGKLRHMAGNRTLDSGTIIAGPFFICGDDGDTFRSLTDEEVETCMERFAQPEDISPEEVQADTGFYFFSF